MLTARGFAQDSTTQSDDDIGDSDNDDVIGDSDNDDVIGDSDIDDGRGNSSALRPGMANAQRHRRWEHHTGEEVSDSQQAHVPALYSSGAGTSQQGSESFLQDPQSAAGAGGSRSRSRRHGHQAVAAASSWSPDRAVRALASGRAVLGPSSAVCMLPSSAVSGEVVVGSREMPLPQLSPRLRGLDQAAAMFRAGGLTRKAFQVRRL